MDRLSTVVKRAVKAELLVYWLIYDPILLCAHELQALTKINNRIESALDFIKKFSRLFHICHMCSG